MSKGFKLGAEAAFRNGGSADPLPDEDPEPTSASAFAGEPKPPCGEALCKRMADCMRCLSLDDAAHLRPKSLKAASGWRSPRVALDVDSDVEKSYWGGVGSDGS